MLDVFNIAKPQNCDIQIFYGSATQTSRISNTWVKPRGVSNIYMLLIGAGANGTAASGGGSGAVTVWYGAAQNIPDSLEVTVGGYGSQSGSAIYYRGKTQTSLLNANAANSASAATAMPDNYFSPSGFFQSVAGQAGSATNIAASATTFLSGGGASSGTQASNYGYSVGPAATNRSGFFMLQPIIVGAGGMGGAATGTGDAGIGCGGGFDSAKGGPGMVLIASW